MNRVALWMSLVLTLIGGRGASGQPPAPELPGRVCHIRVEGDLDCAAVARDIGAELFRAGTEKAGLVLLELEAARSRPDVVWDAAKAVRECPVPVVVYLRNAPDSRVGPGAALLGMMATELFVAPRTAVRQAPADDLRWMAPPDTNWERVERELSGAVWVQAEKRGADPALASALVSPTKGTWCTPGEEGKPWRVTTTEPAKGPGLQGEQIVFAGGQGWERTEIGFDTLKRLGIAKTGPTNASQVLAALGKGAVTRSTRTVKSGLPAARRGIEEALDEARAAAHRTTEMLDIKKRAKGRSITVVDYHTAGREALSELDRARALVDECERVISEYPEVLRQPPVIGAKGPSPRRGTDPISAGLEECRKEQQKLIARARDYAAR